MVWSAGKQLQGGKYKIIRKIGDGGFGLTYLARDSFLGRDVVIKTPKQELETDSEYERFMRRFQREGQALAKISHQNIVQVIELFEAQGLPCLVMAYITGLSLNEQIRNTGPLSQEVAVNCFRKLAEALHSVHQAGLIHCDLHPGNIILQSGNEPVLIDFGSAKFLQPSAVTVTTTVNDAFCPYEQGRSEPEATLDVYGLAATFYFAVTGEKPARAMDRKLYGDKLISPKSLTQQLETWVEQTILAGMALEARDRPNSMQQWLKILQAPQLRFSDRDAIATESRHNIHMISRDSPRQKHKYSQRPKSAPRKKSYSKKLPWRTLILVLSFYLVTGLFVGNITQFALLAWSVLWSVIWNWTWVWPGPRNWDIYAHALPGMLVPVAV